MRNLLILRLAVVMLLGVTITGAQDAGTDPRLSDPDFIKIRDEARLAATCVDRKNPLPVSTPSAQYPDALKGSNLIGTAITEGVILTDGTVGYIRLMRASDPEFGKAAMDAFSRYRYKAATCSGKAVPSFVTLTHRFTRP
jgi:hypothetical protein